MAKKYKNFVIDEGRSGDWWYVYEDNEFVAMVPTEEEARRVIWIRTGRGDAITEDMMEKTL